MLYALIAVFFILLLLYLMPVVISIDMKKNNDNDKITIRLKTLYGLLMLRSEIPFLIVSFENGRPTLKYKLEVPNRKRSRLWGKFTKLLTLEEGENLYKRFKEKKNILLPVLRYVKRRTNIREFELKLDFGLGDAAETGILYGIVWIVIGNMMMLIRGNLGGNKPSISIIPVFAKIHLGVDFTCIISIKLGHIINAGIKAIPAFMSGVEN